MHQTFYIDIDEEITSIVEKLRKTEAPEAVIVVPKRALLIQSIVNLKLLRKEADGLGLKISIVTQDKLGKMLIEKAGISLQQKIEDDVEEFPVSRKDNLQKEPMKDLEMTRSGESNAPNKRNLEKIGSADYFVSAEDEGGLTESAVEWESLLEEKDQRGLIKNEVNKKMIVNGDGMSDNESIVKRKNSLTMDVSMPNRTPLRNVSRSDAGGPVRGASLYGSNVGNFSQETALAAKSSRGTGNISKAKDFAEIPFSKNRQAYAQNIENDHRPKQKEIPRDEQLEQFFYANNLSNKGRDNYAGKNGDAAQKSSGKFSKAVAVLGSIVLFSGLAYAAYLYLPKATVTVFAKKEIKSADTGITGGVNYEEIDYEKSIIPATLLEFDEEVAKTFEATGKKSVSNKKARGTITIYNEFSSSPQPLIATTRFLSENQKIFRLVQGITIPGTTKVGEEIKPGVVEAEVVADESGEAYNISATNFTIPGFKNSGNEKYAKIYAKSGAAMSGGGNSTEEINTITDKDISNAKDKISLEINGIIKQKIKDSADSGVVILDDAIAIDEPIYRLSNSEGETASNFEIKVSAHARALVFSESDIKKIANSVISKSGNGKINIDSGSVIIDYGKANADFKSGNLEIKMHASNVMQPNIDLENLKRGLLGKNSDEIAEYLKTYSNIEKAEVEYFPQLFVNKIPLNEKRVEVILNAIMP